MTRSGELERALMQEIHVYRGFAITVLVENDPAGGSSVPAYTAPQYSVHA
jgi:hypothetical protein